MFSTAYACLIFEEDDYERFRTARARIHDRAP
jgi:hypothetical protein